MLLEGLYLVTTLGVIGAALGMVALAVRAYLRSPRIVLVHLAVGFGLVSVAATATAALALSWEFRDAALLLTVQNGLTVLGYLFVTYSLTSFRGSDETSQTTEYVAVGD